MQGGPMTQRSMGLPFVMGGWKRILRYMVRR